MGDLIDRQAAIDAFGLSEKTRKYGGDHSGYDTRMLYEIQDILEELPPAQPDMSEYSDKLWKAAYKRGKAETQQRWIPCSERLPEKYQAVLATLNNGELTYAWRFDVDEWVICEGDRNATTDDILAWMPMPEPYREE